MHKFIKIMKRVKIKNMLILIMLLLFNSYAWFIYATRVDTEITAHVNSWNVEFQTNEGQVEKEIIVEIQRMYPGMEKFEKEIEVLNKGETKSKLTYEIRELTIMGETFTADGTTLTSDDLETKMSTEFPFKINVEKDDSKLLDGTGSGIFRISLEWDFENADDTTYAEKLATDEKDTEWGNKAYEFYQTNPDDNCIEIAITLIASQYND